MSNEDEVKNQGTGCKCGNYFLSNAAMRIMSDAFRSKFLADVRDCRTCALDRLADR